MNSRKENDSRDDLATQIAANQEQAHRALRESERVVTALIDLGALTAQQILEITEAQIRVNEDFSRHCATQLEALSRIPDSADGAAEQARVLALLRQRVNAHAEALFDIWSRGHRELASVFQRLDEDEDEDEGEGEREYEARGPRAASN